jgi:tagatose-6-phosphate ketose/aldose isomerase
VIFGYTEEQLNELKAADTAGEIFQQPATWQKTVSQIRDNWDALQAFIHTVTDQPDYEIILAGAGTSEYVGNALRPALLRTHHGHVQSIATTDITASPAVFIDPAVPTLLVSFARSGNSPESVGSVQAADKLSDKVKHLVFTCNKDGHLAQWAQKSGHCYGIVLTEETNDQSFVMTSSFTNMYIAALMALSGEKEQDFEATVRAASCFMANGFGPLHDLLAKKAPQRAVFLGSDVLKGIAQESALKLMEITGGDVIAIYDTPMGFRHGPKSVVNESNLTVLYLSDEPYTRRYEMDVLRELARDRQGSTIIAVTAKEDAAVSELADLTVVMPFEEETGSQLLAPAYITVAQTLALLCSLITGHTPDNPCPTGEVNRVVQGVTLYEL